MVRSLKIATPSSVKHFKLAFTDYVESIVVQAQQRDDHIVLQNIEEFERCRREDIAVRPCFFPCQSHLNIPDEALFHPVVTELENLSAFMVSLDNVSLKTLRSSSI